MNHLVDDTPVGKTAEVAVINENIGSELSRLLYNFIRVVTDLRMIRIDGVKLDPAGGTPFDSLFEKIAFTNRPEDEPMAFGDQQFQCCCGKWNFFSDFGIPVFYNSSVKVNCDGHASDGFDKFR